MHCFKKDPPPVWYAVLRFLNGAQYAKGPYTVRKKSCYKERSHQTLLLKGAFFIKEHNKRDILPGKSNNTKMFALALIFVNSEFIRLNSNVC